MRKPERLASGRYKVRFRHGTSPKTGKPKQASETFETRKQADQFAQWLLALGPQGALDKLYDGEQDSGVPTMDELAADHIEHLTGVEPGTRKTYERLWARTWSTHFGHLPANRLSEDEVRRAVNRLADSYSSKSLENQRGLLAGVCSRAVEKGYLAKNPTKGIRLPRGMEGDRVEMRIITPDEFDELNERVPGNYQGLTRFLFGTGARWGESVALTVADVQLPNVRIRRSLKWSPDNDRHVGATKTRKSNRTVMVGDIMLDDLERACYRKEPTDLVFTAPRGGPVLHRTFWSRVWLPAAEPLVPRPRIHDLRHSHASWLLSQGVPIHVVQARLGHESIQTTVDTYGHLVPDAQLMAAHAASLAFSKRPEPPELT